MPGIKDYEHDDPGGRTPKYDPSHHPKTARDLIANTGANHGKLAKIFKVAKTTIYTWISRYEEFENAFWEGTAIWKSQTLLKPLHARAQGIRYTETRRETGEGPTGTMTKTVKTSKYVPPDVGALKFALTNYAPNRFQERSEIKVDTPKLEINLNVPKREKNGKE